MPAEKQKPKVPAKVREIILELGVRYRPSSPAEQQAHREKLEYLCEDLADIPPTNLKRAADDWVRTQRWLPKASELADLVRDQSVPVVFNRRDQQSFWDELAEKFTRECHARGRTDLAYVNHGKGPEIGSYEEHKMRRAGEDAVRQATRAN